MIIKTNEEIAVMQQSTRLTSETLAHLATMIKPGITTRILEQAANEYIRDHGAYPSFHKQGGFPFYICTSVNSAVVHGCPDDAELKEGDLVSLDVGAYMNGFHGDQAYTFVLGEVPEHILKLVRITKESLAKGIEKAVHGNRVGDSGHAIEQHIKPHGYGIVRELVGHGLGRSLHESPNVPNYGRAGQGKVLKENLVVAIEPMVNLKSADIYLDKDGWTIRTDDDLPSVHFEADVCVKKGRPLVLTDSTIIEAAERKNGNLNSSYY